MPQTDYHSIDEYLLNRLDGQALVDFEKRLQSEPDFAAAFAEQKKSMALLNAMGDLEMKLEIQEVQEKYESTKKPNAVLRKLRPWLAAASIALLLGIGYWLIPGQGNEQLYDQYYTAYNLSIGTRDAANDQAAKLAEASAFYKQKNYPQTLTILESLPADKNSQAQLMQGISYLEVSNFEKAIASFDELIRKKDIVFQYHAMWYKAMTYLKAADIPNSKKMLQMLVDAQDPNGVFKQAQAKELLNKIK